MTRLAMGVSGAGQSIEPRSNAQFWACHPNRQTKPLLSVGIDGPLTPLRRRFFLLRDDRVGVWEGGGDEVYWGGPARDGYRRKADVGVEEPALRRGHRVPSQ